MKPTFRGILFLLFMSLSATAQIGTKVQQQKIYGIWQNSQFGYQMTLMLNPDGTGEFDGEPIKFSTRAAILSIIVVATTTDYHLGTPVIVLQYYGVWPVSLWHYAVAVGYDRARGELVLRSGEKRRLSIPFGVLEYTWKESGYWAMVAVPADRIPATAAEADFLTAVMAMERVGGVAAAGTAYATFLERWPGNLTAGIGLANSLYASGELARAEAVLRHALARHPDSVAALNNLAQTLSDQGRNDEALGLIERAGALGGALQESVRETRAQILRRKRDGR